METNPYPDNTGWSGTYAGFDKQADGDEFGMAITFTHTDGRVITTSIDATVGGEVLGPDLERLRGSEDGYATCVDETYEEVVKQAQLSIVSGAPPIDPAACTRNYWIYDNSINYGAAPCEDQLDFCDEREESQDFVVDLDYHGAFAELPDEVVAAVLATQAQAFIEKTLLFDDLNKIYSSIRERLGANA